MVGEESVVSKIQEFNLANFSTSNSNSFQITSIPSYFKLIVGNLTSITVSFACKYYDDL